MMTTIREMIDARQCCFCGYQTWDNFYEDNPLCPKCGAWWHTNVADTQRYSDHWRERWERWKEDYMWGLCYDTKKEMQRRRGRE